MPVYVIAEAKVSDPEKYADLSMLEEAVKRLK